MHFVVTHDHAAAFERVRHKAKCLFERQLEYQGQSLAELLAGMPITTKQDLLNYGELRSSQYLSDGILFSETSGTTSIPLQTPRSKLDLGWNIYNQMSAYRKFVQSGVDRVAILHPSVLSPFVEASAFALHNLDVGYIRVYPVPGVCDYERIRDVIEKYKITTVMSTPSLVYKLLYEIKLLDRGLPSCLKKILITGERVQRENAKNIERIIGPGAKVTPFVYGSSEIATVMIGQQDCSYQPIMEDFVFEIIGDQQCCEDYIRGNLIVTWLREGLLPILRYDTGDVFRVTRDSMGKYCNFHFEGRSNLFGLNIQEQISIEECLYSLSVPIYHFECEADTKLKHIRCTVFTGRHDTLDEQEIHTSLSAALGSEWKISVILNPDTHNFLDFSPSPKSRRFLNA